MSIKVSVIIPTYNRAGLIAATLRTIADQSHQPNEIIVVDDGSRDTTEQIVRDFGGVRYIRIDNSGECRARNIGVSHSVSEYVAFCDSDDLWHPDKLKLQSRVFETSECDYSFTNFRTVVDDIWSAQTKFDTMPAGFFDLPRHAIGEGTFLIQAPMFDRVLLNQPIFPSTVMMKRSFFHHVGRWNESLGRIPSVDLEFHLRCVEHSNIGVVTNPVVGIRKHESNFSGNPLKLTIGEISILRHVLANNPYAHPFATTITDQIYRRTASAAGIAFEIGELDLARKLLGETPGSHRSWKLRAKSLILQAPDGVAEFLRKFSILLGRTLHQQDLQG